MGHAYPRDRRPAYHGVPVHAGNLYQCHSERDSVRTNVILPEAIDQNRIGSQYEEWYLHLQTSVLQIGGSSR